MEIEEIKNIKLNFILAAARTGSTLLCSMLNAHPEVISTVEEPFSYYLYPKYKGIKNWTSDVIKEFSADFYLFSNEKFEIQYGTQKELESKLETYKSYLNYDIAIRLAYLCFFPNKDKSHITTIADKQLIFHHYVEEVARIYPQSKFIILIRDPRDQVLARFLLEGRKNAKQKNYLFWAYVWKYTFKPLLNKKTLVGENRFLEVKYEELILNPEKELQRICLFLDIPYNPLMLEYDAQYQQMTEDEKISDTYKQAFLTRHSGLTQKINVKKIGAWKQGLKPEEANLIWTICGNLAGEIGYEKDELYIKSKMGIKDGFTFIYFYIKRELIHNVYAAVPFYIKYVIKKMRYKKRHKVHDLASGKFYKPKPAN